MLITGGLGFIGSNLAIRLVAAGARVTLADAMIPEYGGNLFNIDPIRDRVVSIFGDICDRHAMVWLVRGHDYVFHLAGQVSHVMSMTDPFPDIEYNVKGTAVVMEAVRRHNPSARVIFTGTRGQYGPAVALPVNEQAYDQPKGDLRDLQPRRREDHPGLPPHARHRFGALATDQRLRPAGADASLAVRRGQLVRPPGRWTAGRSRCSGDGRIRRDFLFVDDCVDALLAARPARRPMATSSTSAWTGRRPSSNWPSASPACARAPVGSMRRSPRSGRPRSRATSTPTSPRFAVWWGGSRTRRWTLGCGRRWHTTAPTGRTTGTLRRLRRCGGPVDRREGEIVNGAAVSADYQRFQDLTFDGFRDLARADGLSCYQQIGFPDSYRQGFESLIFDDVCAKLPALLDRGKVILDVGPGCSELPYLLLELCRRQSHMLLLCDSAEMLAHLPDGPGVVKVPGRYPRESGHALADYAGRVDALLSYSVLQYVFVEQPLCEFLDRSLLLLAEGGRMLLGDVPNVSKPQALLPLWHRPALPPGVQRPRRGAGRRVQRAGDGQDRRRRCARHSGPLSGRRLRRLRGAPAPRVAAGNAREDLLICRP